MALSILFIENKKFDMQTWVDAIAQTYQVKRAFTVSQARDLTEGDGLLQYDLIIMDIMMPPDNEYPLNASHSGLLTGLCMFDDFLVDKPDPDKPIPVFFLTSADGFVLKRVEEFAECHKRQVLRVIRKGETSSNDLKDMIDAWVNPRAEEQVGDTGELT